MDNKNRLEGTTAISNRLPVRIYLQQSFTPLHYFVCRAQDYKVISWSQIISLLLWDTDRCTSLYTRIFFTVADRNFSTVNDEYHPYKY